MTAEIEPVGMPTRDSQGVSRRRIAHGAAWAVPVIVVGTAAPALAASGPCAPGACLGTADTNFGTSSTATNGWALSTTGSFYGGADQSIGWYNGFTYQAGQTAYQWGSGTVKCPGAPTTATTVSLSGPAVVAQGDPSAPASPPSSPGASVTWAKSFCLVGGRTYTFTYNWISYGPNGLAAYQRTYIVSGGTPLGTGGTQLGSTITAPALSDNASGTASVSYTVPGTGAAYYTFYYYWTFQAAASFPVATHPDCGTYANDFAVNAPLVTCLG